MKTMFLLDLTILGFLTLANSNTATQKFILEIPIHKQTFVRFASVEEGRKLMETIDDWVKALSPFDKKLRKKQNEKVSEEEFLSFIASQVVKWNQCEIDAIIQSLETVRQELYLLGINLDLPERILLIKTTGKEEGGAYTRQNAIIIPEGCPLPLPVTGILHEMFHIMTRHTPQIREPLYSIIGYHSCSEVKLPNPLLDRKITNPDAFHNNFFIEVSADGVSVNVMPITYSETNRYSGGELIDYLSFKLMAIKIVNGICQALIDGKSPILFDVSEVSNFYEQIGRNTEYIIHPEEIMAENFAYMVRQKLDVPNPEILDSMKRVLSKSI